MHTYRVAVLRGGPSEEYDVSLKTGDGVLAALDRDRFQPIDVTITRAGEWLLNGRVRTPEEVLCGVDVAFIALHGAYGEDGTVQRLLESLGIPYTGSKALPSAIAMHKVMTKDRLRQHGIKMARHMLVSRSARGNVEGMAASIASLFGPRYVLKPVSGGSSIGTQIADNRQVLIAALARGLEAYEQILVEELIDGREATCGVINNFRDHPLYTLPPIEIVPPRDSFFDYEVKYNGATEEICPGRFLRHEKEELERLARLIHEELELSQYSRSDFIVAKDGVYFLEVNTLPGLTPESLMPKGLVAVGATYEQFVSHLVEDALRNHTRRI